MYNIPYLLQPLFVNSLGKDLTDAGPLTHQRVPPLGAAGRVII